MEPYYNLSYGTGFEGVLNYTNLLVDGLLGVVFLFSIFVIMIYVLSKSEWRMSSNFTFTTFVILFLAWIIKLFTTFLDNIMLLLSILLAGGIVWSIIDTHSE